MTLDEFLNKHESYLSNIASKNNLPNWFNVQLRTLNSRNITVDAWNTLVNVLRNTASDTNSSVEVLKDLNSVLNAVNSALSDKLNKKPFTSADADKNVVVGPDGSLVATDVVIGGGIDKETDPTVPAWAKSSTKPTYKVSEIEGAATQSTVDDLKKVAIGIPTYDVLTGIMTFKTLDNGTTKAVDLPIEKIVDNVTLSEDGKSFVFTFHNSAPITLPIGNITLPAWVTTEEFETATGDKLLIPPNTEAVRNYIIAKISNEVSLRQTADNAIKAAAVGTPTLSGQELIFSNLNGSELKRITLPSGGSSSDEYSHLPLQRGNSFSLQEVAPKVYRARVWKDVDDIYCSYGGTKLEYMCCSNWQQLLPTYAERSKLRVSIATVPTHKEWLSSKYVARGVSVTFHKDAGRIDFYGNPDDTGDDYYIPSHDWYVEIEVDLNQNQCVIKAFQCDNY